MKKINFIVILGTILATPMTAIANDIADITAAVEEHFETFRAADAAGHIAHHMAHTSTFRSDGTALAVSDSLQEATAVLQATFDEGFKFDLQLEELDIVVYGDVAVVTAIQTGTVTLPDGTSEPVKHRRTAIVVRDGSDWKEVHTHISKYVATSTE